MAAMTVKVETRDSTVLLAPQGDVDLNGSPTLRVELRRIQDKRPAKLVIDLSAVPYMDSSGVATLVEAMQVARRSNSRLVLCGMQDRVRSVFEIARLDTVFTIVPDAAAAAAVK